MNREEFQTVLAYVDDHIYEKIELGDLAKLAGYSPFYFSKLFSDIMGMPVTGYIRIRKLQYAIVSLLEGKKVLDVALMYAFDSHEGFTRAFTQLFGSTPSTVRKYLNSYSVPEYVVPQSVNRRISMENVSNMHQLVFGFLEQSLEEAKEGYCTKISVNLLPDRRIELQDNGRGLPLSMDLHASKEVLDKILAGSPITNAEYAQMGDLVQADLQTINSLCEMLQITVTKDGNVFQQDYVRGIAQHDLKVTQAAGTTTGTKVILKPDTSVFGKEEFSKEIIQEWMAEKTKGMDHLYVKVEAIK